MNNIFTKLLLTAGTGLGILLLGVVACGGQRDLSMPATMKQVTLEEVCINGVVYYSTQSLNGQRTYTPKYTRSGVAVEICPDE